MNSKVLAFGCLFLAALACSKKKDAQEEDDVYVDKDQLGIMVTDPPGNPAADNPTTPEKELLGSLLFRAKRISKQEDVSCASCHDLANYGTDGKATSTGTGGIATKRNAPTVYNAWKHAMFFWDFRATTLEEAALTHVKDPTTHGIADDAELVAKLEGAPELVDAFKKAFLKDGEPVTAANFAKAIACYLRTLTTRSRFDDYVEGDDKALTGEEKRGLKLFIGSEAQCRTCHVTRLVGASISQKFGLAKLHVSPDMGRFEFTKQETDKGMFKVPSLTNVTKTGPYLHDGTAKTLEEVVKVMLEYQFGQQRSEADVKALVAFLGALTAKTPPTPK